MAWIYLLIASVFEVEWAITLKMSEGFTRLVPSIASVVGMVLSVIFLAMAVRTLPVGTAYAVWTGIGAAFTAVFGIVFFHEPKDLPRLVCIGLIVAGVVGLKAVTKS